MTLPMVCSVLLACLLLLLPLSPVVLSIDPDEACPVFPQVTANPNTVHTAESPAGQRLWVVLIWVSCGTMTHTCEGSLIRRDWVITAARCLPCGSKASVVVDVGLHHSSIRREVLFGRDVQRVGVDGVHVHPGYSREGHANDLALLHLTNKVNGSFVVNLVECSQKANIVRVGMNCLSAGWGASAMYSALEAKPMRDAYMGIWSREACNAVSGVERTDDGLLCAGAKLYSNITRAVNEAHDQGEMMRLGSCFVQLGGSLVINQPKVVDDEGQVEIVCEWQLCGVLSSGARCGATSVPGVYTNVCMYQSWIAETIRLAEEQLLNLEGCPTLPSPPINGYLCGLEGVSSGRVQFCCERGYELHGPSISSCDRNKKQWRPDTGKCQPISCPTLPTPLHGTTSPSNCRGNSYMMGCWFTCDSGYQHKGSELLTCQEDGTWSSTVPNCEAVDCGPPMTGGNLLVDYTETTYQSTASYRCKTCYQLTNGPSTSVNIVNRTCDSKGSWRGPRPVCRLVHCPQLNAPSYGQIIRTSNTCGSQVRYQCMEGFVMLGMDTATCLPSGQWSYREPFCVSAHCPHPVVEYSINFAPPTPSNPPPHNYSYGDLITVQCQDCHRPVGGSVNLTCLQGGRWDGSPPVCEWVTCPLPSLLPNGQIFPLGNMYFCGSRVRFRCYPGYRLIGSLSTSCGQKGEWSHPFPMCQSLNPEKDCPLFDVPNGRVLITHTKPGGVANVSCDQCYSVHGVNSLKCTEETKWNNPIPLCKRRYCPDLPPLANGHIFKQFSDSSITCNDVMLFECKEGYTLNGPLATTCLFDGSWSHPPPVCKAIECPPPPKPMANSRVCGMTIPGVSSGIKTPLLTPFPNFEDGSGSEDALYPQEAVLLLPSSSVEYCCDGGVLVDGHSGILVCTETGSWSQAAPRCKVSHCPLVDVPTSIVLINASRSSSHNGNSLLYPSGTVLHWGCRDNALMMYGSAKVVCTENKLQYSWDAPLPQCINSRCFHTCPLPPVPDNGRIVSVSNNRYTSIGGISEDSVVVYLCNRGYSLHGSISRKCLSDGVWSGQETMCLTFKTPSSKFIVQNPETKQWQSVNSWHFTVSQQVYLACQTFAGLVMPIVKISGPTIDKKDVRVSEFGEAEKSRQLLMQSMNPEGARTLEGTYLCQVKDRENVVNRTIEVYMHDQLCPIPGITNGSIMASGQTPGSCYHAVCDEGYRLLNEKKAFRTCLKNGEWSGIQSVCTEG